MGCLEVIFRQPFYDLALSYKEKKCLLTVCSVCPNTMPIQEGEL
jgi:hypothetical protein